MSDAFCAYCFGPVDDRRVAEKAGRLYHLECAKKDKAIGASDLTTAEGVRVGGRGADYIKKSGLKG